MTVQQRLSLLIALLGLLLLARPPLDADETEDHQHETSAMESMSSPHAHMDAHLTWTSPRLPTPADQQRAEEIVKTLRVALEKYRDYRVAEQEGFKIFLPQFPQPEYHFTNYWQGFKAAFSFDPARPTSLLYKKTANGYELTGAMYTAPRGMAEERLDERVPLSVARWHAHVNICLPPRSQGMRADWTRFGFRGSIASKAECDREDGRFQPQIFGWMIHVYPFEETPGKIWRH